MEQRDRPRSSCKAAQTCQATFSRIYDLSLACSGCRTYLSSKLMGESFRADNGFVRLNLNQDLAVSFVATRFELQSATSEPSSPSPPQSRVVSLELSLYGSVVQLQSCRTCVLQNPANAGHCFFVALLTCCPYCSWSISTLTAHHRFLHSA